MTCIVGIAEPSGRILMGADSAGVAEWSVDIRADRKVFIRNEMIFGFTTSFRMGQLLQYKLSIPDHPTGMPDYEYLVSRLIDGVRECFRTGGYSEKDKEVEKGGDFLLGYRDNLYQICSDFQVGQREDRFDSIGSGANIALGSLFSTSKFISNNEERIRMAMDAATHLNIGVRPPFHILSLEPNKPRDNNE